jgi:hypothetical protein
MPELSIGRRNHQWGAAKLGVFAYDRMSHERLWQAGVITGTSQARDLWVLGVGPFQRGRTYENIRRKPGFRETMLADDPQLYDLDPTDAYASQIDFRGKPARITNHSHLSPASFAPAATAR